MNEYQFAALIIREGPSTAAAIASLFSGGDKLVTPELIARVKELGSRTASDYEAKRQK